MQRSKCKGKRSSRWVTNYFCTRYNQTPLPTQAYSSLGSSSQSALMRNSLVNSIGRNLDVSPAQVADLLYIGHFFRKFFNMTSQTQGSLALGNPARPQCASKVHKVNYNSFHSKKVQLTIFQKLPVMAKWSTWVFPFRSPCSTAGWTRLLNYELIIDYEIMKDM